MNKLPAFLWLFVLFPPVLAAQPLITGKVVNAADGKPIPGSSVFISNTSKGTTTDQNGQFELTGVPAGKHELVISCVGYETNVFSFSAEQLPLKLKVELSLKVRELKNVTVEPFVEEGWDKWGKLFTSNFVGETPNALQCRIRNHEVIRFRYFKKSNRLIAFADEPLILENRALGYKIKYQLEDFEINFTAHSNLYAGYPLFEEIDKTRKRWQKNRDKAYYGSMLHFMRALYNNTLQQDGFEVRRMKRIYNTEKQRIKKIYRAIHGPGRDTLAYPPKDSMAYYEKIIQQDDYKDIFAPHILSADSLLIHSAGNYKTLYFTDYLFITYKNEVEDDAYLLFSRQRRSRTFQRSLITLQNESPVIIDMIGNYYPPQAVFTSAYWGWSEKMADCLPLDYHPSGQE